MALHHAMPGEIVDLRPLGPAIDRAASSALVKSDRFEAIRLVVRAGATIPAHSTPGFITLHCLEGAVSLDPVAAELRAGDWIFLDRGTPHAVTGIEDSSLLLTILFDD